MPEASSENIKSQGTSQPFSKWKPSEGLQKDFQDARKRSGRKRTLKGSKSLQRVTKKPKQDKDQVGQGLVPEPEAPLKEKANKSVFELSSPST